MIIFLIHIPVTFPVSLPEILPVNHCNWLIWAILTDKMNPIPVVKHA